MAYQLLSVFLLLFGTLTVETIHTVEGKICREELGACGVTKGDCETMCYKRHVDQGSAGSCDTSTTPPSCYCFYSCGNNEENNKANSSATAMTTTTSSTTMQLPPVEKKTNYCPGTGLGLCSKQCNADCCSAKCAQKYSHGDGMCVRVDNTLMCQCQYVC